MRENEESNFRSIRCRVYEQLVYISAGEAYPSQTLYLTSPTATASPALDNTKSGLASVTLQGSYQRPVELSLVLPAAVTVPFEYKDERTCFTATWKRFSRLRNHARGISAGPVEPYSKL